MDLLNNTKERIRNLCFEDALSPFKKFIKKETNVELLLAIEIQLKKIYDDYTVGELEKGDLKGIRAVGFTYAGVDYRLSYIAYVEEDEIVILIIDVDTRENYYRNLKRYINKNKWIKKIKNKGI